MQTGPTIGGVELPFWVVSGRRHMEKYQMDPITHHHPTYARPHPRTQPLPLGLPTALVILLRPAWHKVTIQSGAQDQAP